MLALNVASPISVHVARDDIEMGSLAAFLSADVRSASIGNLRSADELFGALSCVLDFPEYFGYNWDALEECLTDLEWLPAGGLVLVMSDSDELIGQTPELFQRLSTIG